MKVFIDGKYYTREEAKISVFDHGLLYGDGVFEGIRIYHGRIFKLKEHIRRLFNSANSLSLNIPYNQNQMEELMQEAVKLNEKNEGYIRVLVTRGEGTLGLDPDKCARSIVVIIVDTISMYPEEYYTKGIPIITASSRTIQSDALDPRIKSLNYLNHILAKIEAKQAGCMEAVMLNHSGFVSECTGDNIFIVTDNRIVTPFSFHGILEGITRNTMIELAMSHSIPVKEATLTRYDLYNADECFLTGTGAEIIPVIKIDGRIVGTGRPGPVTARLRQAFQEMVGA